GRDRSVMETTLLAADLYEKLETGKLSLDELIKEHSEDPGADDNQGHYRDIDPGTLEDAVAEKLEELEIGEISQPFSSRYGWHVVRLIERKEVPLSKADRQERYARIAEQRHLSRLRENYMRSLLDQPFDIEPGAVRDLMARYGAEVDDVEAYSEQLAPADSQAKSAGDNER